MNICISSGHGLLIRGAAGPPPWGLDEVNEARKVVNKVVEYREAIEGQTYFFHDDVSDDQNENLNRIVDWHNSKQRDLDVSIHFNAYTTTDSAVGCEVLFLTQSDLAKKICDAICAASGLKYRGAKKRDDLFFLNKTGEPAVLIEVAFCDSKQDTAIYHDKFLSICMAICEAFNDVEEEPESGFIPLVTIGSVVVKQNEDGSYVRFISDLDICNDGTGPSHGDQYHQPMTAYYSGGVEGNKYLNADQDRYIVVPPQVRSMVPPIVMGCKGQVTNMLTGVVCAGVTGEIGPDDKTGETAYSLAKIVNPSITYNSGDKGLNYLYELWPGTAAMVDGFTYKLQPA
jgi:N-acetylmuramoyl-L-alanine amidase